MKEARHHIKNAGSVHTSPALQDVGLPADDPAGALSPLRLLASVGDGIDEYTVEAWTEVLRPRRHEPS